MDARTRIFRQRILEAPILRTILWLAWPVFLANLVNISYNLVDALWLGRLGRYAFGAPTVSWPLIMLVYSVGLGYMNAAISLISQYHGAGDEVMVKKSASMFVGFALILAVAFSLVGYIGSPYFLSWMHVPKNIYPLAIQYTRTIFIGIPLVFLGFAYMIIANSMGDTRTPTMLSIISSVANMILDPILIFGLLGAPQLGVVGAATATILSRSLLSIIGGYFLAKGIRGVKIELKYMHIEKWWLKKIFRIGTPLAIQQSSNALGFTIMMSLVSMFGSIVVAAYGVAIRIIDILTAFVGSISRAVSIMIGQNIGAEKYDRARKISEIGLLLVFSSLVLGGILIYFFREGLISIFINDPMVIAEGSRLISIFVWSIPFFGLFFVAGAIANGSGHTRAFAVISIVRLWILRIGLSYLLALLLGFGSTGIYMGMSISNIIAGIVSLAWIRSGRWLKKVIETEKIP